jgi:hypothetical protein
MFKKGTLDEVWMPIVGSLGYAILGKDKALRYTPREKRLILLYKLRVFTFSSGNLSGRKMAELLKPMLPRIKRMMLKEPGPFVASITETGVYFRKL